MKAERTMEQAIRDEAEELKFRRISEERAKMLWEEYDHRYRRAVEGRGQDSIRYYIIREGVALYLKEQYGCEEWMTVTMCRS